MLSNAARALFLAFALCWPCFAHAEVIPVPPLAARVTDLTGVLAPEQKAVLEQTLQAFEQKKGAQLAVLILPTTGEETVEQYGIRVGESWKLGRKGVDDGAILIVAKNDHKLRIEVGYGLEGVLNDATSKRIVSDVIVPRFKQGDFYGGVAAGVDQMVRIVEGESLPAPRAPKSNRGPDIGSALPVLIVMVFVLGAILRAVLGRLPGALAAGGLIGFIAWLMVGAAAIALFAGVLAFFFTLIGGGAGGRYGGIYTGGGFGRGGFGGGGFSGGGGSFGGGGASGSW